MLQHNAALAYVSNHVYDVVMKQALMVLMVLVIALGGSGCAGALTTVNRTALIASTAALACDAAQTYSAARAGWRDGYYEENPVMGPAPSTGTVVGYFAISEALNLGLWLVLPNRYKSIVPLAVVAVQADAIGHNALGDEHSLCGARL